MTYLPAKVVGQWFYLYLILDVYSRKIVGFEVHQTDSSDHAGGLLRRTELAEGIQTLPQKPFCTVTMARRRDDEGHHSVGDDELVGPEGIILSAAGERR